jgi:hypothetical protein
MNSYVGIVSSRGLECFVPESERFTRSLVQRAYCQQPIRSVCYWAIVPQSQAGAVARSLGAGRPIEALGLLEAGACSLGQILPA